MHDAYVVGKAGVEEALFKTVEVEHTAIKKRVSDAREKVTGEPTDENRNDLKVTLIEYTQFRKANAKARPYADMVEILGRSNSVFKTALAVLKVQTARMSGGDLKEMIPFIADVHNSEEYAKTRQYVQEKQNEWKDDSLEMTMEFAQIAEQFTLKPDEKFIKKAYALWRAGVMSMHLGNLSEKTNPDGSFKPMAQYWRFTDRDNRVVGSVGEAAMVALEVKEGAKTTSIQVYLVDEVALKPDGSVDVLTLRRSQRICPYTEEELSHLPAGLNEQLGGYVNFPIHAAMVSNFQLVETNVQLPHINDYRELYDELMKEAKDGGIPCEFNSRIKRVFATAKVELQKITKTERPKLLGGGEAEDKLMLSPIKDKTGGSAELEAFKDCGPPIPKGEAMVAAAGDKRSREKAEMDLAESPSDTEEIKHMKKRLRKNAEKQILLKKLESNGMGANAASNDTIINTLAAFEGALGQASVLMDESQKAEALRHMEALESAEAKLMEKHNATITLPPPNTIVTSDTQTEITQVDMSFKMSISQSSKSDLKSSNMAILKNSFIEYKAGTEGQPPGGILWVGITKQFREYIRVWKKHPRSHKTVHMIVERTRDEAVKTLAELSILKKTNRTLSHDESSKLILGFDFGLHPMQRIHQLLQDKAFAEATEDQQCKVLQVIGNAKLNAQVLTMVNLADRGYVSYYLYQNPMLKADRRVLSDLSQSEQNSIEDLCDVTQRLFEARLSPAKQIVSLEKLQNALDVCKNGLKWADECFITCKDIIRSSALSNNEDRVNGLTCLVAIIQLGRAAEGDFSAQQQVEEDLSQFRDDLFSKDAWHVGLVVPGIVRRIQAKVRWSDEWTSFSGELTNAQSNAAQNTALALQNGLGNFGMSNQLQSYGHNVGCNNGWGANTNNNNNWGVQNTGFPVGKGQVKGGEGQEDEKGGKGGGALGPIFHEDSGVAATKPFRAGTYGVRNNTRYFFTARLPCKIGKDGYIDHRKLKDMRNDEKKVVGDNGMVKMDKGVQLTWMEQKGGDDKKGSDNKGSNKDAMIQFKGKGFNKQQGALPPAHPPRQDPPRLPLQLKQYIKDNSKVVRHDKPNTTNRVVWSQLTPEAKTIAERFFHVCTIAQGKTAATDDEVKAAKKEIATDFVSQYRIRQTIGPNEFAYFTVALGGGAERALCPTWFAGGDGGKAGKGKGGKGKGLFSNLQNGARPSTNWCPNGDYCQLMHGGT